MEEIISNACGLDVHKKVIVATIMCDSISKETRSFGTTTKELLNLLSWLEMHNITHIAMESTGPYWKPVWNILEEGTFKLILANARNIKNVPGRKTDVKDSEWICKLLKNGLVEASLIHPRNFRDLKDLSRYRRKLVNYMTSEKNRILKILEDANIKLSNTLTNVFGKTGQDILEYLFSDGNKEFPKLHKRIKATKEEILDSIDGNITLQHKFLINLSKQHICELKTKILIIEKEMCKQMKNYSKELELLETICGIKETTAKDILAVIGPDMSVFPTKYHIASWAGLCPGNNESAGKKFSSRIGYGDKNLKVTLVECAQAAVKTKGTYFAAKYKQLKYRRGAKKAIIAIAHKIIICCYMVLKTKKPFKELGENFLLEKKKEKLKSSYIQKLTNLGFEVQVS